VDNLVSETDGPGLPRVLLIGDSFGRTLLPLLGPWCRRLAFRWSRTFDAALIESERPDLVLFEAVERSLMEVFLLDPGPLSSLRHRPAWATRRRVRSWRAGEPPTGFGFSGFQVLENSPTSGLRLERLGEGGHLVLPPASPGDPEADMIRLRVTMAEDAQGSLVFRDRVTGLPRPPQGA
jgi:hypothetical protein